MDTNTLLTTSPTPVAPAPAPAPAMPAPAPAVAPAAPPAATPAFADGGSTGSSGGFSWKSFFEGINPLEIGFMILGSTALLYHIYYVRQNIRFRKSEYLDLISRLEKNEAQLVAIKKETAKVAASGKVAMNGNGFRKRYR